MMGSLGMSGWEADVLLALTMQWCWVMSMLLLPQSWPLLIKVEWAIWYWIRCESTLSLPLYLLGTGGILWRAWCGHWAGVHWLMADCHSHFREFFLEGLMRPLGRCTLVDGRLSLPLHRWKKTQPWFASSHLCPPPCLLTLSSDMSAGAWLPSSPLLTSRHIGLLLPICAHHLVCSPFLHRVFLHGWQEGWFIGGLGVRWMWVTRDVHTSCHSLSIAYLRCCAAIPLVLCVRFFLGGFGGCESWPGSQPLSCLLS